MRGLSALAVAVLLGGGFAAGMTLAIAILLQYLATTVRSVEARLTVLPTRWMAAGLLTAGGTGLGSWAFGYPFALLLMAASAAAPYWWFKHRDWL